jgi:hypothetical protein
VVECFSYVHRELDERVTPLMVRADVGSRGHASEPLH